MKERFGLYLIATNPRAGYRRLAEAAVECGVRYLQLRMKDAPETTVLETARMFRDITRGTSTRFIVNDSLSAAMESDADGLHLGQGDLRLAEARARWQAPHKIFGLSTHSMEQALAAISLTPDYLGIGPVFPTRTKLDADPALGPEETGRIAKAINLTTVAIGGINADNLSRVLQSGVENYCVVSAVNDHADPAQAIRTLQKIRENQTF